MTRRICVFCGSSLGASSSYAQAAVSVANYLAANQIGVVYGGGNVGLMGVLADAALAAGGEVIGVIPKSLEAKELAHTRLSALHVVPSMHERKALMAELSDAFLALPGGYGTLEEFCEVLTWTQLGLHRKPCALLNVDGYFDHLLLLFDHAVQEQFVKPAHRRMVLSDDRVEPLLGHLLQYQVPQVGKWISGSEV
jgi:uncharacterized protein (TIGR00730 family)